MIDYNFGWHVSTHIYYGAILTAAHILSCIFSFWRPKFQYPTRDFGTVAQVRWPILPPLPPDRTAPGTHQTRSILRVGGCHIRRWLSCPPSPFIEFSTTGWGWDLLASSRPLSPLLSPHVETPPADNIIMGNGVQSKIGARKRG